MDIENELLNNRIILVIITKENFNGEFIASLKVFEKNAGKICYICVNQPYSFVINNITKNGMQADKFFFIDALTKSVQAPPIVDNCIFVSAPNALTEISLAISKAINEKHCDCTVFDTLSTLMIYENPHSIIQFVHNVLTKIRISAGKALFIALKDDVNSELVKDLYMFVDKVVDASKTK